MPTHRQFIDKLSRPSFYFLRMGGASAQLWLINDVAGFLQHSGLPKGHKSAHSKPKSKVMEMSVTGQPSLKEEIGKMVRRGGPDVQEYQYVDNLLYQLSAQIKTGIMSGEQLSEIRSAFGPALSNTIMQGFMWNKPHGYAGNFEIIERMYDWYVTPNTTYAK